MIQSYETLKTSVQTRFLYSIFNGMLSYHRISYCFLRACKPQRPICHVDHDLALECDQKWLRSHWGALIFIWYKSSSWSLRGSPDVNHSSLAGKFFKKKILVGRIFNFFNFYQKIGLEHVWKSSIFFRRIFFDEE